MAKRENQRAKQRAKKALYDRPEAQREKSRRAKRRRARANGKPMSSRSHESAPWWDRGVRGSLGAFVERSAVATRA